jgi:hypothetical protein
MIIILNKGITKESARLKLNYLINQANKINGSWDKDELFFNWDQKLQEETEILFKNKAEIAANFYIKGRYANNLPLKLTRIVTPPYYEEKRKERSNNNKTVFLCQLSTLLGIMEELNKVINLSTSFNEEKIKIFISKTDGIYRTTNGKKLSYGISGKRQEIVFSLENGKEDGKYLANQFSNKDFSQLSKEIISINKLFCQKLELEQKLIIPAETRGYLLNNNFELVFV